MARAKKLKESAPIQPVVEPEPEVVAATAPSAAAPGQAHANRPIDQVQGEGMTRAEKISAVINTVMTADDAVVNKVLDDVAQPAPEHTDAKPEDTNEVIPDEEAAINQASHDMKPSNASVKMVEAIEVMFAGENLTPTFKNKASAIFEAMVAERVQAMEEELTKELCEDFDTQLKEERQHMEEALDAYITKAATDYLTENRLSVENGIKSDLYESLITDIGKVLKVHNIAIDDDQIDLVTEAYQEADEIREKANQLAEDIQQKDQVISELSAALVFEHVSSDMTAIQKEALANLAESVEFDDVEVLTDKLSALKEHIISKSTAGASQTVKSFMLTEKVSEEPETTKYMHPNMNKYMNAVSTHIKKS